MELTGTREIRADRETVWAALLNERLDDDARWD